MSLKNVTTGGSVLPARLFAYGIDGIGKTSFGAEADKVIFVPTEDGCTRVQVPQFPISKSWDELFANIRSLAKEQHDYKTLVLDTADWAQRLAQDHIVKNDFENDLQKFDAYGKGYKVLIAEWTKLLSAFDYLRGSKGMQVILLAHATVKTFKNPSGDDFDQYKANLIDTPSTSILGVTREWADIVLFMNYKVVVKKESVKATKGKGIMANGGKRVCYSSPSAAYDAKVRAGWNLPAEFDLDYKTYDQHVNGNKKTAPQAENEAA